MAMTLREHLGIPNKEPPKVDVPRYQPFFRLWPFRYWVARRKGFKQLVIIKRELQGNLPYWEEI